MKVLLIWMFFITTVYAGDIAVVFEMPDNSGYRFTSRNVLLKAVKKESIVTPEVSEKVTNSIKENTLRLSGIFKVSGEYVALIDGEPYREKSKIGASQIVKIDINSATLLKNGKKVRIYVENN